jgi:hypothetical protein
MGREQHGGERFQIGFTRERLIERFEPLGRLQQQGWSVAAAVERERDLTAQQLHLGALELSQRPGFCDRHQSECHVERTRLVLGLCRSQRAFCPARELGRQRASTLQNAAAAASPPRA